jgi:hypothetical protein
MTGGSSMLAMTLSFPPQRRHTSMSIAKTRLRRCAQEFVEMLQNVQSYFFTADGQLILALKYDSGSMIFR